MAWEVVGLWKWPCLSSIGAIAVVGLMCILFRLLSMGMGVAVDTNCLAAVVGTKALFLLAVFSSRTSLDLSTCRWCASNFAHSSRASKGCFCIGRDSIVRATSGIGFAVANIVDVIEKVAGLGLPIRRESTNPSNIYTGGGLFGTDKVQRSEQCLLAEVAQMQIRK